MRIDETKPDRPSDDYVERVNRAIDHIVSHLSEPLRLDDIARIACFSPFHFHRVFRLLMKETLNDFIKRQRLERALRILAHDPKTSMTRIALRCGFAASSDFSRAFKQHYGAAPSRFDLEAHRRKNRANLTSSIGDPEKAPLLTYLPPGENPDGFKVTLRELPERVVAYLRVLDPFRQNVVTEAMDRFMAWAEARGLADNPWLGYMWEDPEIVPLKDCRYDIGLVVKDHQSSGEIGRTEFPAMLVAEIELKGGIDLEQRALDWIYGTWLPTSGYVPADLPGFESWIGRPFAHGLEHFELHVQIPIVRG